MATIVSNIQTFIQKNSEVFKIIVLVVLVGVLAYIFKCRINSEEMTVDYAKYPGPKEGDKKDDFVETVDKYGKPWSSDIDNSKVELKPEDLLPKTELDNAFKEDRALLMGDYLVPGISPGIDSVGSSLKKKNWSLRSTPQIPVNRDVSPWGLSSYENDYWRKPLE